MATIVITSAVVPEKDQKGDNWDWPGGLPDTYVEVEFDYGGTSYTHKYSTFRNNTLSPTFTARIAMSSPAPSRPRSCNAITPPVAESGRAVLELSLAPMSPVVFAPGRSRASLEALVLKIHKAGLQSCIHSNGDREIDIVLISAKDGKVIRNLTPGFDQGMGFEYIVCDSPAGIETGALMAMSKLALRTMPGIDRPALAALMPTLGVHPSTVLAFVQSSKRGVIGLGGGAEEADDE